MSNFIIKTYQKGTVYNDNRIFILNKGMNSGKPSKKPFTNSFVIIFDTNEDCENMYWIAYSLWKANFWHPSLIGSVIPFLRIQDFKNGFNKKVNQLLQKHEQHLKQVQALRLLEQKENKLQQNIALINEMRTAILNWYCRK
jgi:hypothetical protein